MFPSKRGNLNKRQSNWAERFYYPRPWQSKADKGQEEHGNAEVNEAKSGSTVQFPTGGKARDKGFDKSIVVVVAFSAIPIEMIEILV